MAALPIATKCFEGRMKKCTDKRTQLESRVSLDQIQMHWVAPQQGEVMKG